MLIDWFTVAVQIINFLILIALLRRFLYGPLLRVMDERRQGIEARLARAAAARQQATDELTALARERQALTTSREARMGQAAAEVDAWKEAALVRIKEEIAESRGLWQRQLRAEQALFMERLKAGIGEQVVRLADKVLADLADQRLEARLVERFVVKLDQELAVGRPLERGEVLVTSGQPLSPESLERLRRELSTRLGPGRAIRFVEDPGLGFGIRLTTADYAWEWNLNHYLAGLEQEIRHTLTVADKPGENP